MAKLRAESEIRRCFRAIWELFDKYTQGVSFMKCTGFKNPSMDFFFGQKKQKSKKKQK